MFPERFGSLADARMFMDQFVDGYNHEHRHTGIGLHTPADIHYGLVVVKTQAREVTLAAARATHPNRFSNSGNPKILDLPEAAWINPPFEHQTKEAQAA